MAVAREIDSGRLDWPGTPQELIEQLVGAPISTGKSAGAQVDSIQPPAPTPPAKPKWLRDLALMAEQQHRIERPYALMVLEGLEQQSTRRKIPWICDMILTPRLKDTVAPENGSIRRCLADLALRIGVLDSTRGGNAGYVLKREKWAQAKADPYIGSLLDQLPR